MRQNYTYPAYAKRISHYANRLYESTLEIGLASKYGLLETLFPTRCAICDTPGELICKACFLNLPWINMNYACKRCGSAWGITQCTECNPLALKPFGLNEPPFDSAFNALIYNNNTKRLIHAYKDEGERRLAKEIGAIMARYVPPEIVANVQAITYIPASKAALRKRGFDQMQLVAHCLASVLGLPVATTLERPQSKDQRELNAYNRMKNMKNVFAPHPNAQLLNAHLILADDVMTTGATIYAASTTLKSAGVSKIHAVTLARTYGGV